MEYSIIVDSGCDTTPQLEERFGLKPVPLTLMLGEKEFIDDESLDLPGFMAEMKACKGKVSTAAAPPYNFMEAIEAAKHSFIVTLSSRLSATYANAVLGKTMAEENGPVDTYIFDSKSAAAGEVLIAIKIRELISAGMSKAQIIKTISSFIDNMKTYFVLERYDNLIKNGRINVILGKIVSVLNFKMIMGSDGDGNIALYAKPRGIEQMIERMMRYINDMGRPTTGETMVISHCNNLPLAEKLINAIQQNFDFKEIVVVPTKGTISVYADDKGIILAF